MSTWTVCRSRPSLGERPPSADQPTWDESDDEELTVAKKPRRATPAEVEQQLATAKADRARATAEALANPPPSFAEALKSAIMTEVDDEVKSQDSEDSEAFWNRVAPVPDDAETDVSDDEDDEPPAPDPDPVTQAVDYKRRYSSANCMACKECQPNQMAHFGGCMPDPDMPDSDDEDENVCPTAEE